MVAAEVSQTSPLPAPTRLNAQEERPLTCQTQRFNDPATFSGTHSYGAHSLVSPQQLALSNDDFSILATNFFSQGQEFLRGGDTWENIGNF